MNSPHTADPLKAALAQLSQLWQREREASRASFRAERDGRPLAERVARGTALAGLQIIDTDASPGGRVWLWVAPENPKADSRLNETRIGQGAPVRLWSGEGAARQVEAGVVARVLRDRLAVAVHANYGDFLDQDTFALDLEAPEVTFDRGDQALARFTHAKSDDPVRRLGEVLFADTVPRFTAAEFGPAWQPLDLGLNPSQRAAVDLCLRARDVALVHGPPGTGKTRTLCEVVCQLVRRGQRVLVTAASHAAVDNLAERVAEAGVALLRLGHPARVAPALEDRTLDALVDRSEARKLAKRWIAEANALRRKVDRRKARGTLDRQQQRAWLSESRRLMRDAREALAQERKIVMARCPVMCCTAAGADASLLRDEAFDVVVVDEAAQAPDPLCLFALQQAPIALLGGDSKQLPPTVLDPQAAREGLAVTLFERVIERHGEHCVRMLDEQYRMHEDIMRFPSHSMYAGALRAHPSVAGHRLEDLGVAPDPLRDRPWWLLDTAGKGWDELRNPGDPSTSNPAQAERVIAEVQRLLQRGLSANAIAVITPYQAQVAQLRDGLRALVDAGLEVGTVDGFQGREKEAVIVDLVRSNPDGELGFLNDVRRTHVALTRARRFLIVVGDSATLQRNRYYENLVAAAEAQQSWLSAWADDAPCFDAEELGG